jgi:anti-anti-sigma factor
MRKPFAEGKLFVASGKRFSGIVSSGLVMTRGFRGRIHEYFAGVAGDSQRRMELNTQRVGNCIVVSPRGRVDHASADAFSAALAIQVAQCSAGGPAIVLDMSGVDYISSVGLRALMVAAKQVKAQSGRIAVAALTPMVREVFQISRFHLVFDLFDGVDAALGSLQKPT